MRRAPELAGSLLLGGAATALWLTVARTATPAATERVGHALGGLGFLLMLLGTFGYSRRKRLSRSGPGSLEQWLRFHVVAGIVGPWLVLLHTGFAFQGAAGTAFLLMVVVVASGLLARYGYVAVPRQFAAELLHTRDTLRREAERLGAGDVALESTRRTAPSPASATDALVIERRALARLAEENERQAARAVLHQRVRSALAWWWVLHVPVALAMFALAAVHAAAALYYATLLR